MTELSNNFISVFPPPARCVYLFKTCPRYPRPQASSPQHSSKFLLFLWDLSLNRFRVNFRSGSQDRILPQCIISWSCLCLSPSHQGKDITKAKCTRLIFPCEFKWFSKTGEEKKEQNKVGLVTA
ncbi:hypothetical protein chiPu_0009586 [Chiloscyllium punctatum]|uniref:Uncharacterized protein n=1 Tax=Chiloscyllium punctatum TaxID=137246 RepID=A0A401SL66_CHIPU|nr:hypothetical protein [Chiloscyllium punctatum]